MYPFRVSLEEFHFVRNYCSYLWIVWPLFCMLRFLQVFQQWIFLIQLGIPESRVCGIYFFIFYPLFFLKRGGGTESQFGL